MIICIDSNVIIWGIKKQATATQEPMIERAEHFFKWADAQGHELLIPSVVLAEILVPEPPEIRKIYLELLSDSFILGNFDSRAAVKYAEILHNRTAVVRELAEANEIVRQRMKIDHTIIATALVNGANCICTTDNGLKAFAAGFIDIRDLPPIPIRQPTLFDSLKPEDDKNKEKDPF